MAAYEDGTPKGEGKKTRAEAIRENIIRRQKIRQRQTQRIES